MLPYEHQGKGVRDVLEAIAEQNALLRRQLLLYSDYHPVPFHPMAFPFPFQPLHPSTVPRKRRKKRRKKRGAAAQALLVQEQTCSVRSIIRSELQMPFCVHALSPLLVRPSTYTRPITFSRAHIFFPCFFLIYVLMS